MKNDVAQLATDLDKAPSGEVIIERLLTAQVRLPRENAELKAKLDNVLDQLLLLTNLVDSDHAAILVLQGQRHQGGGGESACALARGGDKTKIWRPAAWRHYHAGVCVADNRE